MDLFLIVLSGVVCPRFPSWTVGDTGASGTAISRDLTSRPVPVIVVRQIEVLYLTIPCQLQTGVSHNDSIKSKPRC
jgi:hypothetical protein